MSLSWKGQCEQKSKGQKPGKPREVNQRIFMDISEIQKSHICVLRWVSFLILYIHFLNLHLKTFLLLLLYFNIKNALFFKWYELNKVRFLKAVPALLFHKSVNGITYTQLINTSQICPHFIFSTTQSSNSTHAFLFIRQKAYFGPGTILNLGNSAMKT